MLPHAWLLNAVDPSSSSMYEAGTIMLLALAGVGGGWVALERVVLVLPLSPKDVGFEDVTFEREVGQECDGEAPEAIALFLPFSTQSLTFPEPVKSFFAGLS